LMNHQPERLINLWDLLSMAMVVMMQTEIQG